jgi:hypothetical protein
LIKILFTWNKAQLIHRLKLSDKFSRGQIFVKIEEERVGGGGLGVSWQLELRSEVLGAQG